LKIEIERADSGKREKLIALKDILTLELTFTYVQTMDTGNVENA
jgi:hypothetical protein